MDYCDTCNRVIIFKQWLKNPDWFSLKDEHYCSNKCYIIGKRKKEETDKEKCKVCFLKINKNKTNRGKEYPYLCTNCELLAFKGSNEEII